MKKNVLYTTLIVFAFGNVSAETESSEIFPWSDITIGMSSKELLEKYPTENIWFPQKNDAQVLETGMVAYDIPKNKYWDSLGVRIENAKVKHLIYCRINKEMLSQSLEVPNFDNVIQNIKPLFHQLQQQLGTTFEKKVSCRGFKDTEVRGAVYVWKRKKDFVAFSHTPVSLYTEGSIFNCQVTIAATYEELAFLCHVVTDSLPEDAALWADAMGEQELNRTQNKTSLWLYAGILLCLLCPILYFLRRKLKTRKRYEDETEV